MKKNLLQLSLLLFAFLVPAAGKAAGQISPTAFDCGNVSEIPQSECQALVALYASTNGPQWLDRTGWLETATPCSWQGIVCGNNYVDRLDLGGNRLSGSIPVELGNLSNLSFLSLGGNGLSGSIPVELGNLSNLGTLSLAVNRLSGSIPAELGNLSNLGSLSLTINRLSGPIPDELGNLSKLSSLNLSTNQLSGPIPDELGNLSNLGFLSLSANQLSGPIPVELGNLSKLSSLNLSLNQLGGSIPAELGNLSNLGFLSLGGNQLSGSIPVELGNLSNLGSLSLGSAQLSGSIPVELGKLSNLGTLSLNHNQLSGSIPVELGNLSNLGFLYLHSNQLSGSIPDELGKLSKLDTLYLLSNQLSGPIPVELGNLSNLVNLDLSANQLSGSIPVELGNLSNLFSLDLDANQLSGPIPVELRNLSVLYILDLSANQLSGPIPSDFNVLTKLHRFHFYDNDLCEPTDITMKTWLDEIGDLESTGILCGATLGNVAGVVKNGAGNALPKIAVSLNRYIGAQKLWRAVANTTTDVAGAYRFDGLGTIGYSLYFTDPSGHYGAEYYNNTHTLDSSTTITASLGTTVTVDVVLDMPAPPAIAVTTTSGNLTTDTKTGNVTISMPRPNKSDITIVRAATCPNNAVPISVELIFTRGDNAQNYAMSLIVPAPNYQATIPAADLTEKGTLSVQVTCGSESSTTDVGKIQLYDPSGQITDASTNQPITNATVTLYQVPDWHPKQSATDNRADTCQSNNSKTPDVPWTQPAPTALGVLVNPDLGTISPAVGQMQTNTHGRYGWDVAEGCWYVVITAPDYEMLVSPIVGVPPAVTDLDLQLIQSDERLYLPAVQR